MQRMIWMNSGVSSKLSYGNKLFLSTESKVTPGSGFPPS
jgi:hypothetical protein